MIHGYTFCGKDQELLTKGRVLSGMKLTSGAWEVEIRPSDKK